MPPPTHHTYCEFHLGDNLFHLHFLRWLALKHPDQRFIHSAHGCHLEQMREVIADLKNVTLTLLEDRPDDAINAWKDAGGFFGRHPWKNAYYEFYLDWFAHLAGQMGLESPFFQMTDLLFDYPALLRPVWPECRFDTLLVNSQPCSGQWMAYSRAEQTEIMDQVAREMALKSRLIVTQPVPTLNAEPEILCTREAGLSVTQIGNLSIRCQNIVMIGTGPAWPTCNVFNHGRTKRRIVLLEPERVNYDGPPAIRHARDFSELRAMLVEEGLI